MILIFFFSVRNEVFEKAFLQRDQSRFFLFFLHKETKFFFIGVKTNKITFFPNLMTFINHSIEKKEKRFKKLISLAIV